MNDSVPQLRFLRGLLLVAWFGLGAWLLASIFLQNFPLSGQLAAVVRTSEPSGFFGGFTPLDRGVPVQVGDAWYTDAVGEPIYFNIAAPTGYDSVRVSMRYRNAGQPYVALGARADLDAWAFDLKPIDLPMLDTSDWSARQDDDLRIYERRAGKLTARELLASGDRTAVLGLEPVRWGLKLPVIKNEKPLEATLALPGSRSMYVYAQDAPFQIELGLRGAEDDEASVSLVRDGQVLLNRTHVGNGSVELELSGAEPGLYRVDLRAPASVTLVGVHARQSRLAFLETDGAHLSFPEGAPKFDPEFPVVTWETDLKRAPYDVIIAKYRPPTVDADGWSTAEATFDLHQAATSGGKLQMVLSLPAIKKVGGKLRIDSVGLSYERRPFSWQRLTDLFKSLL